MRRRVSSVRIVAGKFKGLKIPFKASKYIRPTTNRTKETIFSWLINDIKDSRCLDMFAGTGSLGLEAISRGASFVYFAEKNRKMCEELYKTIIKLNIKNKSEVMAVDSLKFPFEKKIEMPLDIVFIDPPFRLNYLKKALSIINDKDLITDKTIICSEVEKEKKVEEMFRQGVIEEVKLFSKMKINKHLSSNKIIGIKEISDYLENNINLDQAKELIKLKTRQYAKRQYTWARGHMKSWDMIYSSDLEDLFKKAINKIS